MKDNKEMHIQEVDNQQLRRDFFDLPSQIYKGVKHWIHPLQDAERAVFDRSTNKNFESGDLKLWILKDRKSKVIGRIAAFVNKATAFNEDVPIGAMGFFECIHDRNAAFLLFDTAKEWLQVQGMEAMEGPINFGEKDRFWGLLVDGFDKYPPYLLNYHPQYYRQLFEDYGFKNYYEQYVYELDRNTQLPPIVERSVQRLSKQSYYFTHLKVKDLDKYAGDFQQVYNKAWDDVHENFNPISKEEAIGMFNRMKAIVDEELIIFAYHKHEPIAIFVGIPELNEIFRFFDGKLTVWNKLRFWFLKKQGKLKTVQGLLFGIVPEYRNKGIESGLIMSIQKAIVSKQKYQRLYLSWIGDFNPKMVRIVELLTKKKAFTLITYRKYFDEDYEFNRHPVL